MKNGVLVLDTSSEVCRAVAWSIWMAWRLVSDPGHVLSEMFLKLLFKHFSALSWECLQPTHVLQTFLFKWFFCWVCIGSNKENTEGMVIHALFPSQSLMTPSSGCVYVGRIHRTTPTGPSCWSHDSYLLVSSSQQGVSLLKAKLKRANSQNHFQTTHSLLPREDLWQIGQWVVRKGQVL